MTTTAENEILIIFETITPEGHDHDECDRHIFPGTVDYIKSKFGFSSGLDPNLNKSLSYNFRNKWFITALETFFY